MTERSQLLPDKTILLAGALLMSFQGHPPKAFLCVPNLGRRQWSALGVTVATCGTPSPRSPGMEALQMIRGLSRSPEGCELGRSEGSWVGETALSLEEQDKQRRGEERNGWK